MTQTVSVRGTEFMCSANWKAEDPEEEWRKAEPTEEDRQKAKALLVPLRLWVVRGQRSHYFLLLWGQPPEPLSS